MHNVILVNAAGVRTEHKFVTLSDAMGACGPKNPLILDGHAGYLDHTSITSADVKFVETDHVFQFFGYAHLPERLQAVSRRFYELAEWTFFNIPRNPERTKALNKLLESKDCAVRALIAT